jgi:hypothetical protein
LGSLDAPMTPADYMRANGHIDVLREMADGVRGD